MTTKNLRLAKSICWYLAGVSMFFLIFGNRQNNLLSAVTFVLIIAGIIFSALHDKKG